jgi:hypothetical protein
MRGNRPSLESFRKPRGDYQDSLANVHRFVLLPIQSVADEMTSRW